MSEIIPWHYGTTKNPTQETKQIVFWFQSSSTTKKFSFGTTMLEVRNLACSNGGFWVWKRRWRKTKKLENFCTTRIPTQQRKMIVFQWKVSLLKELVIKTSRGKIKPVVLEKFEKLLASFGTFGLSKNARHGSKVMALLNSTLLYKPTVFDWDLDGRNQAYECWWENKLEYREDSILIAHFGIFFGYYNSE